ncbi:MAG: 16S rRNA (uracil(1498)-N(3))-methyltransferase [Lachnospiraceae bacterium]|nr:16S rRNA (uracil(1498)-N(3))-methyltransferase [Lachnospiraceae bacterium]
MHQFFVEPSQIQGKQIYITGKDVNHIRNVLRMQPGEEISISNGMDGREYRCGIERIEEDRIICSLRFIKEEGVELPARVYLFQGLPKADKMELIIQKAVELGVHEIIPVAAKRSVVKLEGKKAVQKTIRWQGISEAAAKQSKRAIIPRVWEPISFKEAVSCCRNREIKIIPYELEKGMKVTRELISSLKPGMDIAVFIGPEGGFAEEEIELARESGILPVSLGKRILRTETAGLTVLAWIMYQLEEENIE